jgi:hypothetical protein
MFMILKNYILLLCNGFFLIPKYAIQLIFI